MNKVKQLISHNISSKNLPLNNKWSPVRIFIQSYFCYFKSKHETFPCPYSRSTVNTGKFSQWGGTTKEKDKSQSQRKICQMQSTQKYYAPMRYYITKLHSKNSH